MRLKNVAVTKLFGIFDHEIPMDKPDGLTIIHGPNGFGKTVMLKMIAGALTGDPGPFLQYPFDEFRMTFQDGNAWSVYPERTKENRAGDGMLLRVLSSLPEGSSGRLPKTYSPAAIEGILDRMDSFVPGPYSRSANGWEDDDGIFYTPSEIIKMFPEARRVVPGEYLGALSAEAWKPLGIEVFVVEANRLSSTEIPTRGEIPRVNLNRRLLSSNRTSVSQTTRIEQYSRDLVQRIKDVRSLYAEVTQQRDSTFPERLVQFLRSHRAALPESEVVSKLEDLDRKRQSLITLGFLDKERVLGSFKEEDANLAREVLTIYVDDVQAKLSAFDEMASRTGKLMEILKDRYEYKKLRISREDGFLVESEVGTRIKLGDLSSGEQHELIMLYELLFRTPENGLILVDEPEISLHVGWQTRFLQDLLEIVKLNSAYALVATHSPVLIGNQWALTKELHGPEKKEETVKNA